MKIRGIQFSPVLGNVNANLARHENYIQNAINDKADLIIFPELSISGYHLKDLAQDCALSPQHPITERFRELSRDIAILIGAPFESTPGIIHNCALFFSNGELLHNHQKVQLPNFGMFEEHMIFKPGNEFKTFKIGDFTTGILICREILFPITAWLYFIQNTDLLIGISNSPFRGLNQEGFSSLKLWERMGEVFAIHHHQHYVFVNRTGFEDGIGFGGGSFYARPNTGIVNKCSLFEEDTFDVDIDPADTRRARLAANYLRDEKPEIFLKELQRILHAQH